ncbi:MAG: hypothetical protein HYX26_05485 [Acidobacteriales bacterium]|nr:hypothetical protein [Terriglobales bacterium]
MNPAHLHLILNHIPVIGILFGLVVMLFGIGRKSPEVRQAALFIFVVTALFTIPAYLTGDPAEHFIIGLPEISRKLIHRHEDAAKAGIWVVEILGALSLLAMFWKRKKGETPVGLKALILIAALMSATSMAWTSYLGGKIRHPEMVGVETPQTAPRPTPPVAQPH